jgi:hypothetical protein
MVVGFVLLGLMLASFGCASVDRSLVTSAATKSGSAATRSVVLSWENEPLWAESQYAGWCVLTGFAGIQASTDLVHWVELVRQPYAVKCSATLSNRPASEFYRAFTGWNAAKLK